MSFVPFVRLWLWVSAFAVAAGWTLSALGQLNRAGYVVFFIAFIIFVLLGHKELGLVPNGKFFCWKKFRHRFRRPLPLCFVVLAGLIFLGGALYPPTNYTGISYRVPRVLQWLAHEQWTWIHTPNYRMNDRACGIEWLTAPLLLFTKSDRALFLINFIPFLLLPGLIYSVFTRLGIRARVAWQWMWLLPTGYGFLLQAGSIANDTFPVVFALAMIDFAARAWSSRQTADLWHSILAAALLIGAKASNLPLLLPWAILIFAMLPFLRRKSLVTLCVLLLSALVSFLPMALLNNHYCGDWSGAKLEPAVMVMKDPWVGLYGNTFQLLMGNSVPPLFPLAGWWNQHAPLFMPHFLTNAADNYFDTGFFSVGELPTEDLAGIGFGLSLLVVVSVVGSFFIRKTSSSISTTGPIPNGLCRCVMLAAWISLLAYCMKSGMTAPARLIAPYYALVLPLLLTGTGQSQVVRRRWWHLLTGGVLILAFIVLIVSPDRPLWPAKTILSKLHEKHPDQRLITRALNVYTVYSQRSDSLAGVRALLPSEARTIGFIGTEDDPDISLWRPFGGRRVEHFFLTDSPEVIRRKGVEYVVVGGANLEKHGTTFEVWQQQAGAETVAITNAMVKITEGLQPWYVVRLKP
ncbi:MAG: hypothetical protein WDM80_11210 [Limisphaerales bacterium]